MYKQKIQLWFETERGGGLVHGWFGRPYDNIHTLASVDELEDALVVVLSDGRETLRIAGLQSL